MSENLSASKNTLIVRHLPGSDPVSFQVVRLDDGKMSQPAAVPVPHAFPVEGRPNSNLMLELQWYLETFLDYPFPPETEHAERILKALRDWGEQAFRALFGDRSAGRMFDAATQDYSHLHLQISSDDPRVLSWPWEALRDPELGVLAHTCQIERRLNTVRDPQSLPTSLPDDRVNILLVVARPYGKQDVRFRSIARPLVELIEKERLPAYVELLRPPTFDELIDRLRKRPGFFHILHFDGHGAYAAHSSGTGYTFQGPEGKLVFETEDGNPDEVTAEKLSALLKECAVPAVVLNACQSAMVGGGNDDPFSSVATALLRSGMRDVVAMAYSLYVSGAQKFLPAFYRRLFEEGNMAAAVRGGRQYMWKHDKRVCVRGEFPLQDWLLPVLYQQEPYNFSFAAEARNDFERPPSNLPEELRREKNPYGFIGRDSAILGLERSMRRAPAGILIHGLGGVGKTTLARGFLQWLDQTGGLEHQPFWFSFQEIRSAEYVFNRVGEALFGGKFSLIPMEKRLEVLASALRENPLLIVWDNFESAAGIQGTTISANLPDSDRKLLSQFLDDLRGGATKVIIMSRSSENWLRSDQRYILPLGGLDREERWEYCNAILRDQGKAVDRDDEDLVELMNLLGGHPLAMRAVLPRLEKMTAAQILDVLRSNLSSLNHGAEDEDQAKLYATLAFVQQSLPEDLRPLLVLVGLHEGFIDADYLEIMAKQVDPGWTRSKIDALAQALAAAGLLRDLEQATYEMHPLLTSYLRSVHLQNVPAETQDQWARAFVDFMGYYADNLAPKELHEQRVPFHFHGQNLHHALAEAERLGMATHVAALTQSLASFAQNNRSFSAAARLLGQLAEYGKKSEVSKVEAIAYHQLGMIAQEERDFAAAEHWFRKSLAISEKLDNEQVAADTYHQLGIIAQERRDFAAAEQWYRKSLAIEEKQGNEQGVATSYHQLGVISEEQRDFAAAEQWYHKSLAIKEKQGNEHGAASTYHQLGIIAQEQCDFAAAERWYRKSLAIEEKQGNEHGAASTYAQLGMLASLLENYIESRRWLIKALLAFLSARDEHLAARAARDFMRNYKRASVQYQEKLESIWREAGLGNLPSEAA